VPISPQDHNQLIQQEFTRQAQAYAANPTISDDDWVLRLIQAVQPSAQDRVLEIACGPGYVAMAFARFARQVVGIDLTEAPLTIAEATRLERGLDNVRFEKGDGSQLSFADASFDQVVSRLAFHHFADPTQVLGEMVRVCRPGGKVAVEDLVASEDTGRAAYHNRWERLRDPSHATALPVSKLLAMFNQAGLEVVQIQTIFRPQVVAQWLKNSQTPPDQAAEVWSLLEQDEAGFLSGMRLFRNQEDALCFDHRMVTLVGHKPA